MKIIEPSTPFEWERRAVITFGLRVMLARRQNGRCAGWSGNPNCNRDLSEAFPHCDHIIPNCEGGTNDVWNLQMLCPRCNTMKGGKVGPIELDRVEKNYLRHQIEPLPSYQMLQVA